MEGCICHFVEWKIHPFISKGTIYVTFFLLKPYIYSLKKLFRSLCTYYMRMLRWMIWHCPPDTDSKFESWWSEAAPATSLSRRLFTILILYEWAGKTFCFLGIYMSERCSKPPFPTFRTGSFNHCTRSPPAAIVWLTSVPTLWGRAWVDFTVWDADHGRCRGWPAWMSWQPATVSG